MIPAGRAARRALILLGAGLAVAACAGLPHAAPVRVVGYERPAAADRAVQPQPPTPPPGRAEAPSGRRPGPAPGLEDTKQCSPPPADGAAGGPGPAALRLADVHRLATGRGQVIAVIDTGVSPHPLLAGRLTGGGDYLTGGDGLDDCDGHGTAVAGLLAAAPEPVAGPVRRASSVGIAPGARLLAIRQSSPSYSVPGPDGTPQPAGDTDTLAEAVVLAVRGGADVVNISEAVCLSPERAAAAGAPLQAALRYAADADVVVVAAAGNVGSGSCAAGGTAQVSLPGWYDDQVLTVGAVEPDDRPAPFTVPGPWVDVAAPGTGLRSLAVGGGTTAENIRGTSFAAPWAAGLAALVRERFPELTARQVVDRILATARRAPDGRGALGHGVLDPIAALTAVPARLTPVAVAEAPTAVADLTPPADPAGPAAGAPPRPDPGAPVDVLATAALLVAVGLAVALLRQGPAARRRTERPGPGRGTPPPPR